jgi:hypothetical protein
MAITENVYSGRSNKATVQVEIKNPDGNIVANPLSGVTRMVCDFVEPAVVVDVSDDSPTSQIYWQNDGAVVFDFGSLVGLKGLQKATLVAYDPTHPLGRVICYGEGGQNSLSFNFMED